MVSKLEFHVFVILKLAHFSPKMVKICDFWPKMTQNERLSEFSPIMPYLFLILYLISFAILLSCTSERFNLCKFNLCPFLAFMGSKVRLFRKKLVFC